MMDNGKIPGHVNLIAVINRLEENIEDAYTQLTCRVH